MQVVWEEYIPVCTYLDNTHGTLLHNDIILLAELIIDCGATKPTSAIATLVKTKLEIWLDAEPTIGTGNWTEIT